MITVWVRYKSSGDTFLCSFIYASNCAQERWALWEEMELLSRSVVGSADTWIIQGDFNVALHEEEQSRFMETRSDRAVIREFQNAVLTCDMVDLAQVGSRFTWTNCQDDNPISKKLDRVMVNSRWLNTFSQSYTTFESGGVSDHLRMFTLLRVSPPRTCEAFQVFQSHD